MNLVVKLVGFRPSCDMGCMAFFEVGKFVRPNNDFTGCEFDLREWDWPSFWGKDFEWHEAHFLKPSIN